MARYVIILLAVVEVSTAIMSNSVVSEGGGQDERRELPSYRIRCVQMDWLHIRATVAVVVMAISVVTCSDISLRITL